ADPLGERVFSLAHELAHFLRHHWLPRRRACRRLGEGVASVLDGQRPATPGERVSALLAEVPLGFHVHLMVRGPRRAVLSREAAAAEEEAARLAYELLAPAAAVAARTRFAEGPPGRAQVAAILRRAFGLTAGHAETYSRLLVPPGPEDPLLRRLGLGP